MTAPFDPVEALRTGQVTGLSERDTARILEGKTEPGETAQQLMNRIVNAHTRLQPSNVFELPLSGDRAKLVAGLHDKGMITGETRYRFNLAEEKAKRAAAAEAAEKAKPKPRFKGDILPEFKLNSDRSTNSSRLLANTEGRNFAEKIDVARGQLGIKDIRSEAWMRDSYTYATNCSNSVLAYELRRRGYNVFALPVSVSGQGVGGRNPAQIEQLFNKIHDPNPWHPWELAYDRRHFQPTDSYADMAHQLREWPMEARGFVLLTPKYGNAGHIISVEKPSSDMFQFIDPQIGEEVRNMEMAAKFQTYDIDLLRVDDLTPSKPKVRDSVTDIWLHDQVDKELEPGGDKIHQESIWDDLPNYPFKA